MEQDGNRGPGPGRELEVDEKVLQLPPAFHAQGDKPVAGPEIPDHQGIADPVPVKEGAPGSGMLLRGERARDLFQHHPASRGLQVKGPRSFQVMMECRRSLRPAGGKDQCAVDSPYGDAVGKVGGRLGFPARRQAEDRVDVAAGHPAQGPGRFQDRAPDRPGCQGLGQRGQGGGGEAEIGPVMDLRPSADPVLGRFYQEGLVLPHDPGGARQAFDDPRLVCLEQGKEFHPDPVSQETRVGVGRVGDKGDARFFQVGKDLFPADAEQGPDDRPVAQGGDPGEPGRPAPPEKAHENGFRLVVLMMAEGDPLCAVFFRRPVKKPVPGPPGFFLQASRLFPDPHPCPPGLHGDIH